ncbi:MAG TPA: M3 family oligoendopeptidase, partial [Anaerolineae bacterium]|nr:M3 family oligoendopeptidase [Anaerolineae bacterium]
MADTFAQTRWNLKALLPAHAGPQLTDQLSQLEETLGDLESARSQLTPDLPAAEFVSILKRYELVSELAHRLGGYAFLWFTEDTQNQDALNFKGRIDQLLAQASNRMLFFSLWIKSLDDAQADRLLAASGDLRYYLESLRRFKPYTLGEAVEQIITLKDVNGIDALVTIYDMITNKFEFTLEIDGETKTLTRDALGAYVRHPSPDVRAAVYRELYRVYGEHSTLLAQIYNFRVRDWHAEAIEVRHYAEPISVRNLGNDIPDAVTDVLLAVSRNNNHLFQRYFTLKAKWLGLPKLRRYDIYAPLLESEKQYDYNESVQLVLDSFRDFSPVLADQARRVFVDGHIDAEVRPGKRGGAFCAGMLPNVSPWVLVNFAGRARDVATLAHELGHAIHALLAADHSVLTFHSSLPLAETASTFAEMLLTDRLLKAELDPAVRRDLLAGKIDDAYATVQRQAYFTLFEREAHRLVADGGSVDEITTHYVANLAEQFGDAVDIAEEFKWEWISIPHIYHTPFYT